MLRLIPSRRLLRQLAVACSEAAPSAPCRAPKTRWICQLHSQRNLPSSRTTTPRCPSSPPHLNQLAHMRHASTGPAVESQSSPPSSTTTTTEDPLSTSSTPLPDTSDYYTLFPSTLPSGGPPNGPFSIPLPQLRQEFLRLQSVFHPDKFSPSSSPSNSSSRSSSPSSSSSSSSSSTTTTTAYAKAVALSALINQAYKTLSDPLLRAQYLLQTRHDIDVTSEDNSAHPSDQETLMEVLDAQEAIEEADGEAQIEALNQENEVRVERTVQAVGEALENGDVQEARKQCVRLRYWRSLGEGLNDWEKGKEVRLVH